MKPEEIRDTLKQYTEAHNAALADPLRYEREECARLVEQVRTNYADAYHDATPQPLEAGNRWLFGLGWFTLTKETPEQLRAVSRLCVCLAGCERGTTEAARMLDAKRLWFLLERAQRACGFKTLAETAESLTETQIAILRALDALRAFDGLRDTARRDILECSDQARARGNIDHGINEDNFRENIPALHTAGLVAHNNKGTRWRRYWLTTRGAAVADYLKNAL